MQTGDEERKKRPCSGVAGLLFIELADSGKGDRPEFYEALDKPSIDHIYPRSLWINLAAIPEADCNCVHMLGNLMEVGVVDNSSKNNSMLNAWLQHAIPERHAYRRVKYQSIMEYFDIPPVLSGEMPFDQSAVLIAAIRDRTTQMKSDIIQYLCGDTPA